jgi:LysR family nod box-dependent transcriptional activator
VRKGLAGSHRQLTRELFSILSHVQWGGDDEQELTAALLNAGLARRIGARVACLLATPWMVAQSDMSATVPARFARWAAGSFAVDVLEPPVPLPKVSWASSWSRRSERNAAVTWVRDKLIEAGRSLDEDE